MPKTEARTLSGFMELLPADQILFNNILDIIKNTYEKYGFLPLDTPVIELSEVLLAKAGGETEKQIYRFNKGDNDLSLRFDLTVPLAKYVAKNYNDLSFPFRRYQIGKVYRGEKPQKGRFREFYQCDIDVIGDETLDIMTDAEIPAIIYSLFKKLNFGDFTICINNRKILNGLFESLDLKEKAGELLIIVDKLAKIGKENVIAMFKDLNLNENQIETIINFIEISGTNDEKIEKIKSFKIENDNFIEGLNELEIVVKGIRAFGVLENNFNIDLTISRGLDYYTGTVYETFLNDYREIGSVCSGGRYEDLSKNYIDKKLPGVGISIGLTRLFYVLKELNVLQTKKDSISKILIIPMTENLEVPIKISSELRNLDINTEIYLNNKKLKQKMKYADKLGVPYIIVIGDDEIESQRIKIKNMESGEEVEEELNAEKIANFIKK